MPSASIPVIRTRNSVVGSVTSAAYVLRIASSCSNAISTVWIRRTHRDEVKPDLTGLSSQSRLQPYTFPSGASPLNRDPVLDKRYARECEIRLRLHDHGEEAAPSHPHLPCPWPRRFDGEEANRLKRVIVHLRGIDTKVVARRLNDCDELQALEGDEEVNTFDRRVEWNLEVVHAVVELAAGANHSFSVAHRGRHLVADPC